MLRFRAPPINYKWGCKNCLRVGFVNGQEQPIGFTSALKILKFAEPRLSFFPSVATMVSFPSVQGIQYLNWVDTLAWLICELSSLTKATVYFFFFFFSLSRVSDRCERDYLLSRLRWLLLCRRPPASLQLRCHSHIKRVDHLHGGVCIGVVAWSVCLLYTTLSSHTDTAPVSNHQLWKRVGRLQLRMNRNQMNRADFVCFAAEILSVMSRQTVCCSDLTPVALLHPAQRLVSSEDQRELANKTFWFKA